MTDKWMYQSSIVNDPTPSQDENGISFVCQGYTRSNPTHQITFVTSDPEKVEQFRLSTFGNYVWRFDPKVENIPLCYIVERYQMMGDSEVIIDWQNVHIIDTRTSEFYGIMPYGKHGMEVLKNGKCLEKFTESKNKNENWFQAFCHRR